MRKAIKKSAWYELDGFSFEIQYETGTVYIGTTHLEDAARIEGKEHTPQWLASLAASLADVAAFSDKEMREADQDGAER